MNRPKTLETTLKSMMKCDSVPNQVIIVDQSSQYETSEMNEKILQSLVGDEHARYIHMDHASLTEARNIGFGVCTEKIIVLSDDDVDVYDDTYTNIYSIFQDKSIALVAATDDNTKHTGSKIGYILGTKSFRKRKIGHVTKSVLGRYPESIRGQVKTEWAMGYFFAIRENLCNEWNIKWDSKLTGYAYAEDLDFTYAYCKKAAQTGLRCILDERVHVKHMVSREYRIPTRTEIFTYVINRLYLSYKHHMGWQSRLAMNWCNIWILVSKVVRKDHPGYMAEAMLEARRCRRRLRGLDINSDMYM